MIQASKPTEMLGSTLKLSTKYKFHKDRIEDVSIKSMIEGVLKNVFGKIISVEAVVDETTESNDVKIAKNEKIEEKKVENKIGEKNSNMMNNLLKNFGGKVVNT